MVRQADWDPKRKKGRKRQAHFMDVALDGYVRYVALVMWRRFEDLSEAHAYDGERAMEELAEFPDMGAYAHLWQEAWRAHVWPVPAAPEVPLFGRMEAAVREAVLAERSARVAGDDDALEDTPRYKAFVAQAMDSVLEASAGESEEMD